MSATASPWIKDVTDATFEQDVFEASKSRPVVIDFWNEYCGPCMALKPILEQAAVQRDGAFQLAKCNTNHTPRAAQEFGVQGIPAVFAVIDGKVVDFFNGLIPQHAVDQWLDGLALHQTFLDAERLEQTDPAESENLYRKLLDAREDFAEARIGMARALLAQNEPEAARDEIAKLERRGYLEPEAQKVLAQLNLDSQKDVDLDGAQQAADSNPDDLDAQIHLAEALAGHGQHESALDRLLTVIEKQKTGAGETAREKMLEIFKVLGDDNDTTREYRRKLSSLLF
ncbi:MAG: tetratricopeptide repeat protein [Planctomycetales bacterium]|nr:tetratricopeptide repeat protein [Planctomycetales bacterium]